MKKRIRGLISGFLVYSLIFHSSVSTIYAEENNNEYTEDSVSEISINLNIPSTFNVKIPKKIILNGTTKTGHYKVYVKGNIAGKQSIFVEPEESIVLTQLGKSDGSANVLQTQTEWNHLDITENEYIETEGVITASNISAGQWKSKLKFTIALGESSLAPGLYDEEGTILCNWEDSGIDITSNYSIKDTEDNYVKTSEQSAYTIISQTYPSTTRIVLPKEADISYSGVFAFCDTLTEVILPKNTEAKSLGTDYFYECTNLLSITIPKSVTSFGTSFCNCSSLTTVILPNSLKKIATKSFQNCTSLKQIVLPSSLEEIGMNAFRNAGLTSIDIPASVQIINSEAFKNTSSLTDITFHEGLKTIYGNAFEYSAIEEINLPEGLTFLGSWVFLNCKATSINIPNTLTTIGTGCFQGTKIVSCTWPSSMPVMANNMFLECKSLQSIVLPSNLTTINAQAFKNCISLKEINFCGTEEQWNAITFGENWNLNVPNDCIITFNYVETE